MPPQPVVPKDGGVIDVPHLPGQPDASIPPPLPDASPPPPRPDANTNAGTDAAPPPPNNIPAACSPADKWPWVPSNGPTGGINGHGVCGHNTGSCPTTYTSANVGAACSGNGDCTGAGAVCLTNSAYGGGTCSTSGCELGSNLGCPSGDVCVDNGNDTYCFEGCGIDQTGCFRHCTRTGFACFNTESKTMGYCLYGPALGNCDPQAGWNCDFAGTPGPNDGLCVGTAWDDPKIGKCFEACDPITQDCSNTSLGCYLQRDLPLPTCYQSWGFAEGASCTRLTHCAPGMACECDSADSANCPNNTNMHCRRYCSVSGAEGSPCAAGTTCRRIKGDIGTCQP